jgi:magnesium transporter
LAHWDDLADPHDPALDRIAAERHIHPLHLEDMRERAQRTKIEEGDGYIYVVLKLPYVDENGDLRRPDLDLVLGRDWILTLHEPECKSVDELFKPIRNAAPSLRADQIFHRIFDAVVDSYLPLLDHFDEEIDAIEDRVIKKATPESLSRLFSLKRNLIDMRRTLTNTRDVANFLQRYEGDLIQRDLGPYLRDVYDHLSHNLDTVETQRDLLASSLDVYLSSVANKTNQVMKVLTVLGTIALPAIVISGYFGMNVEHLPWTESSHGLGVITFLMVGTTILLLALLRALDWL